jgi:hypothetical protein
VKGFIARLILECPVFKSFGYKLPGYFMEYGPIQATNEESARLAIRKRLGVSRLPWGVQVWDLSVRPLARWRVDQAS